MSSVNWCRLEREYNIENLCSVFLCLVLICTLVSVILQIIRARGWIFSCALTVIELERFFHTYLFRIVYILLYDNRYFIL